MCGKRSKKSRGPLVLALLFFSVSFCSAETTLSDDEYTRLQNALTTSDEELAKALLLLEMSPEELTRLKMLQPMLESWQETLNQQEQRLRALAEESAKVAESLRKLNAGPMINLGLTADYGASGLRVGVSVGVTF